jgi:Uma2 family endonuclease
MALMLANRDVLLRSLDKGWTAADWEGLPHEDGNRYEIIGGVLYMSSPPNVRHQRIVRKAVLALFAQIDDRGLGMTLWSPLGVFLPSATPVQPDLLVVRAADFAMIGERQITGVPALLVEVLSPSTAKYDREVKREAYARAGLLEYWIVRPEARDVLVYSEPEQGTGQYLRVTRIPPDGELVSPTLPFRAAIADFFTDAADEAR